MPTCTFRFKIAGPGRGGPLKNRGQSNRSSEPPVDVTPLINAQDTLAVTVEWGGNRGNAPDRLRGHFIFAPTPAVQATQVAPSPFLNNGHYTCFTTQFAQLSLAAGEMTYPFAGLTYPGGLAGKYELTFIAEADGTANSKLTQWSVDPEFDTSS